MGLLAKLKSVLGSGSDERSGSNSDADVTVEYAPDAESEHAVKGTDGADVSDESEADESVEADDDAESGAETDESETETASSEDEQVTESDEDGAATESSEDGDTPESPTVDEVKGIGPTYSGRLEEAAIGTIADLAAADAEAVAEAAEVSVSRAEDWIERARSRT